MKKYIYTIFFILFFITIIVFAFSYYWSSEILINQVVDKKMLYVSNRSEFILSAYNKLLNVIQSNLETKLENIIPLLYKNEFAAKSEKSFSSYQLKKIAQSYGVDHIYFINIDNGIVYNTSFDTDLNLNLYKKAGMSTISLLKTIKINELYNKVYSEALGTSTLTGKINKYSYYLPEGKDYFLEVSVDIKNELKKDTRFKYFEDFLFESLKNLIKNSFIIKNIELYNSQGWSFIKVGKKINLSKTQLSNLLDTGKLNLGSKYYIKLLFDFKTNNNRILKFKNILELEFDKTAFIKNRNRTLFKTLFYIIIVFIILFFIILFFIEKKIISRFNIVFSAIQNIKKGDYNTKIPLFKGSNELSELAENINNMAMSISNNVQEITSLKDYLNAIFQKTPWVIIVTDDKLNIIMANKTFTDILEFTEEKEIVGKNLSDFDTGIDMPKILDETLKNKGKINTFKSTVQIKDKELIFNVFAHSFVTLNQIQIVFQANNITEKELMKNQIVQSKNLNLLGTLAGGISHDFNNLLGGIRGYIELIKLGVKSNRNIDEYIEVIENSIKQGSDLVKNLLGVTKTNIGEPINLEFEKSMNSVIKLIKYNLPECIFISVENKSNSLHNYLFMDETQFHQIFINLILNAKDAILDNEEIEFGKITIIFEKKYLDENAIKYYSELKSAGNYFFISIQDNGKGIEENHLKKVFEPFWTTKISHKGNGLGLATVLRIVTNNNGSILIHSEQNKGTKFTVVLPEKRMDLSNTLENNEEKNELENKIVLNRKVSKVVVVDDNSTLLNFIKDVFINQKIQIHAFSKSRNGLDFVTKNAETINLLLMDINMPELNGYEVLSNLKKNNIMLPIILMTGFSKELNRMKKEFPEYIYAVIKKPFSREDIFKYIDVI